MSQDTFTPDGLRERLSALETDVLQFLAKLILKERAAGLDNDTARVAALVAELSEKSPVFPTWVRQTLKGELDYYVQYLRGSDGQLLQISDRLRTIDARLEGHDERVRTLETKSGLFDTLPKILALVVSIAALFGVSYSLWDVFRAEAKLTADQLAIEKLREELGIYPNVQHHNVVEKFRVRIESIMMDFSTETPPLGDYPKLASELEDVRLIERNSPATPTKPTLPDEIAKQEADDATMLKALFQLADALDKTKEYRESPKAGREASRKRARDTWDTVDGSGLVGESHGKRYQDFAKQVQAYRINAIAVFDLDRTKEQIDEEHSSDLEPLRAAVKAFDSNISPSMYPRIYLNHAAAVMMLIDREAKSGGQSKLSDLFRAGNNLLTQARVDGAPGCFTAALYNNRAYYNLQAARFQLDPSKLNTDIVNARSDIERAKSQKDIPAMVFATAAEVEAFDLTSHPSTKEDEYLKRIGSNIEEARHHGLFDEKPYADDVYDFQRHFIDEDPFFAKLSQRGKSAILIGAGFIDAATQPTTQGR